MPPSNSSANIEEKYNSKLNYILKEHFKWYRSQQKSDKHCITRHVRNATEKQFWTELSISQEVQCRSKCVFRLEK